MAVSSRAPKAVAPSAFRHATPAVLPVDTAHERSKQQKGVHRVRRSPLRGQLNGPCDERSRPRPHSARKLHHVMAPSLDRQHFEDVTHLPAVSKDL